MQKGILLRSLAITVLVFFVFSLSSRNALAAPSCSVSGSVQASDQAFVDVNISMDTASETANFPFRIMVADPSNGNSPSTNTVSLSDCSITSTKRTCTYRLSGNRGLFGLPNNNTQQLSYFLQFSSNNNSIVCQNALSVPPIATPLLCGTRYPAGTQGICPCNGNINPSVGGSGQFCCGWVDDTQPDACSDTSVLPAGLCSSPVFNQQSQEYTTQVPNSLSCRNAAGQTVYKCRDTYNSTPTACIAKTTCRGSCMGDASPKDYSNGTQCTGLDGVCYVCTAPNFAKCAVQPPASNTGTGNPGGSDVGLTAGTFDTLNTAIFGLTPDASLTTPRGIIGRLLPYLFTFGGLTLFVMLVWGGFEMLTGAANPKSQEAGKQRMTAAVIGFILLFASYWLAQIVQAIFGINIL